MIEEGIVKCDDERAECETLRRSALGEIGNLLHDSVIISNDEVGTTTISCQALPSYVRVVKIYEGVSTRL